MTPTFDILTAPAEAILDEMRRIRTLYALKSTMRYNATRDPGVHNESVAEHLFGMHVLSNYFLPLEDPHFALDRYRINELIIFHELGEIETGDILFHRKSDEQKQAEREAAARVVERLPSSLQRIAHERFIEFDEISTPEALFANAIDKVEPIFEIFEQQPAIDELKVHGVTMEISVGNKKRAAEQYPYMRRFLDVWQDWAVSLDAFAR